MYDTVEYYGSEAMAYYRNKPLSLCARMRSRIGALQRIVGIEVTVIPIQLREDAQGGFSPRWYSWPVTTSGIEVRGAARQIKMSMYDGETENRINWEVKAAHARVRRTS